MTKGTFYGVGVGPGDPELMTLKGVRVLEACQVLAVPVSGTGTSTALNIAQGAARLEGKEQLTLHFPMRREPELLSAAHQAAADTVAAVLDSGRDVAMPVLGDVAIYSTYSYLQDILEGRGYRCVMVPGVPSFCAVAARLGRSLTQGDEPLHILPASARQGLELEGTKVLMKSGRQFPEVLQALKEQGLLERSGMVENCGMAGERVHPALTEETECGGYFATLVIGG